MKKFKGKYFNRELNWIAFNQRVLDEALDPSVPLLERLKFLSITGSNLDEFFMVRVGGLMQIEGMGKIDPSGMTATQQLEEIRKNVRVMVRDQYACFNDQLEPTLKHHGVMRLKPNELTDRHLRFLGRHFDREILPIITPTAIPPGADFPLLANLGLNLFIRIKQDANEARSRFAILPLAALNRFIRMPSEQGYHYILVEDAISVFLDRIFVGVPVAECVSMRLARNADLAVMEDAGVDLLFQMEKVLDARKQSDCVRLEVDSDISGITLSFLQRALSVADRHVYRMPGPLRLGDFMILSMIDGFDALKYKPWPPQMPPEVDARMSMFRNIARRDILLIHPYESFDPVVRFIEEAAEDPDVLAIKQILYRVSRTSPIVSALRKAAERGKYVTVLLELKARFDEARNIEWARNLEKAGAQVIYGVKGLKTHAKLAIVVRREPHGIVRYMHFGTGNYNDITARIYSDVGYMTCNEELGADATAFFNAITGYSQPITYRKIEAAPTALRERLIQLIEEEMERKSHGQKALIMAKMNSLVDPKLIEALYKASQAKVKILLNVRGICCLVPGVKGLSENITVVSVVDRFLEHARIFYFYRDGEEATFISSADWMQRNLDKRVELMVPVEDITCKRKLISMLEIFFQDNAKSRRLLSDGTYERITARGRRRVRSQEALYARAGDAVKLLKAMRRTTFEPHRPADVEEL